MKRHKNLTRNVVITSDMNINGIDWLQENLNQSIAFFDYSQKNIDFIGKYLREQPIEMLYVFGLKALNDNVILQEIIIDAFKIYNFDEFNIIIPEIGYNRKYEQECIIRNNNFQNSLVRVRNKIMK